MAKTITILNGPNLNLLGQREPDKYGHTTLPEVEAQCAKLAAELGLKTEAFQSNHEGSLLDHIHAARDSSAGIIINPVKAAIGNFSTKFAPNIININNIIEAKIPDKRAREPDEILIKL